METNTKNVTWTIYFLIVLSKKWNLIVDCGGECCHSNLLLRQNWTVIMVTRVKVKKQTCQDIFWGNMSSWVFSFKVCEGEQLWVSKNLCEKYNVVLWFKYLIIMVSGCFSSRSDSSYLRQLQQYQRKWETRFLFHT